MNNFTPLKRKNNQSNFRKPIDRQENPLSLEQIEYIKSLVTHQDKSLIIIDKPSGLAAQSGSGISQDLDSLMAAFAKSKGRKPRLVHRLDRETSGLVLIAKTKASAAHFSNQFAERLVEKTYYAIVAGIPSPNMGIIDVPLKRGRVNNIDIAIIAKANDKDAQNAITDWEIIESFEKCALLKLSPKTGRMHQLRAHLSHIGHPILGDTKYGGLFAINGIKVPRLMLHAGELEIRLEDGSMGHFNVPAPDDMLEILEKLRK